MPNLGLSLETSSPSPASFQAQQAQVQGIVADSADAGVLTINGTSGFNRFYDYEGIAYWYYNNTYLVFFSGSWNLITNEEYYEDAYVSSFWAGKGAILDSNSYSSSSLIPTSNWTSNATIIAVIAPSSPAFSSTNTDLINDLPSVTASWTAPTSGTPPFSYTISRRVTPSGTVASLNTSSTSASFSNLMAGVGYTLNLRATNEAGQSALVSTTATTSALTYISTNASKFIFSSSTAFSVIADVTNTVDGTVTADFGTSYGQSSRIANKNGSTFYAFGNPSQLPFELSYLVEAVYNSSSTKWNIRFACMDENYNLNRFTVFAESTASQTSTRIPKTGWTFITGNVTSSSGQITLDHYHP